MTTLTETEEERYEMAADREEQAAEMDTCWSCGRELESQVQFNVEPGRELVANLRKRGIKLSAEEITKLNEGLLCDDCALAEACPNCNSLGGQKFDCEDRDDSVGYHAEVVKCSLCIHGMPEDDIEMLRRQGARQQGELFGAREYRVELLKEVA